MLNVAYILCFSEVDHCKVNGSLSYEQLSMTYPHQPDLVTNSVPHKESSRKLHHLELQCATLTAELSTLRSILKHRTFGFEAMITLVQHLTEQVCCLLIQLSSQCGAYLAYVVFDCCLTLWSNCLCTVLFCLVNGPQRKLCVAVVQAGLTHSSS